MIDKLRFPIGKFSVPVKITGAMIDEAIDSLDLFPDTLENMLNSQDGINEDISYRPGGWNMVQLIHHLSDSHTTAYFRFKLSLTENVPTIKPYDESKWALLPDATLETLTESLGIIRHTHKKWAYLMRHFKSIDWQKKYYHPEKKEYVTLAVAVLMYQWHAKHHLEHLRLIFDN